MCAGKRLVGALRQIRCEVVSKCPINPTISDVLGRYRSIRPLMRPTRAGGLCGKYQWFEGDPISAHVEDTAGDQVIRALTEQFIIVYDWLPVGQAKSTALHSYARLPLFYGRLI